ncbi:crossover junction endodeoxyribonuclease RuvC [candidate division KSB1 bacterium]|jgi:crossover junction endodeoxyribonuclease RuvC|nr:crossover junction endodeoxyribonuclease RuvC [candidate division KSB1 bacterium]
MMVILGVDPGSQNTGYGLILASASQYTFVHAGCLRCSSRRDFNERLKLIYDQITDLMQEHDPEHVAFEDVFYGKNFKSALKLGQARGAAVLAALNLDKQVFAYSAREVKQAITGYGNASKEQVRAGVTRLLNLSHPPSPLDASDALAIALCHAHRLGSVITNANKECR